MKHAGTENICTPNKCISDVSLQNSIDPNLSPAEQTVSTTTTDTSQFEISQVNSEGLSYSSFDSNSSSSNTSDTLRGKQYFMSQPILSCESIQAFRKRRSQYKANPLVDNPEDCILLRMTL